MQKINLLDCTLRDGGYINDWKFGHKCIKEIILNLVKANTDIIEAGFLRNVDTADPDVTQWRQIEEIKELLPYDCGKTVFSAMALHNKYDINNLSDYNGKTVDLIRVTFHDYDVDAGLEFCRQVKEKGYKVSCNPINIMGYTDGEVLGMIEKVNALMPEAFSIVDTFGSMNIGDLDRLTSLVDHNLEKGITLGLHLHENMAQAYPLAQKFLEKHLQRNVIIDGSLMGMGRAPGNLSIELIAHYLNENYSKNYEIDYMLENIENYILPIREKKAWGYAPAYFLSAKYNLHRNYAEHYLDKGNLTQKDINHLLSRIETGKKTVFDADYADELYHTHMCNKINDTSAITGLKDIFQGKDVLLLAPGASIKERKEEILALAAVKGRIVVSVNFIPDGIGIDYAFFGNNKRYSNIETFDQNIIISSNLKGHARFTVDYDRIARKAPCDGNSLLLFLTLLSELEVGEIFIAGADGYGDGEKSYFEESMGHKVRKSDSYNRQTAEVIKKLGCHVTFVTPSKYEQYL